MIRTNETQSPDDFIKEYKAESGGVSFLDQVALRLHPKGGYQLIFGDIEQLNVQLNCCQMELTQLPQLITAMQMFKKGELTQTHIDNLGLKFLKFLDVIICLSFISNWQKIFWVGPQSLAFIEEYRQSLKNVIKQINHHRKQSFLKKILSRPPKYVAEYFQRLLTHEFFHAFLWVNATAATAALNMSRRNSVRALIERSNRTAQELTNYLIPEKFFRGAAWDHHLRTFLALQRNCSQSHQVQFSSDFLNLIVNSYNASYYRLPDTVNTVRNQLSRQFDRKKHDALQILLKGPCDLTPQKKQTQNHGVIQAAMAVYTPPPMERDTQQRTCQSMILYHQNTLQRELDARIVDTVHRYRRMSDMSQAQLAKVTTKQYFSLFVTTAGADADTDFSQMLAVFYVAHGQHQYIFTGMFVGEVDEPHSVESTEVKVFANQPTLSFLKSLPKNITVSYTVIAPSIGLLREWIACKQLAAREAPPHILSGLIQPSTVSAEPEFKTELSPFARTLEETLNKEQKASVRRIVSTVVQHEAATNPQVSVIVGPPGTGKTHLICALIALLHEANVQVVILASNNLIVADIMRKLEITYPHITFAYKVRLVQSTSSWGRPQLIPPLDDLIDVVPSALSALRQTVLLYEQAHKEGFFHSTVLLKKRWWGGGDSAKQQSEKVLKKILTKLPEALKPLLHAISNADKSSYLTHVTNYLTRLKSMVARAMPIFAPQLNAALNQLIIQIENQNQMVSTLIPQVMGQIKKLLPKNSHIQAAMLATVDVIGGTLHGLAGHPALNQALQLRDTMFGKEKIVAIVDEAGQASVPSILALMDSIELSQLVLVGDPPQLTQVTHSDPAPMSALEWVLRYLKQQRQQRNIDKLCQSYRAGPLLTRVWSKLTYHDEVSSALLESDHGGANRITYLSKNHPMTLIDIKGREEKRGTSYVNRQEAHIAVQVAINIMMAAQDDVAIITMYLGQSQEINTRLTTALTRMGMERFHSKIHVGTVDAFQGREAPIVIVCTTRTHRLGYIAEPRRLNVALSRAKKKVILLGHVDFLKFEAAKIVAQVTVNPAKVVAAHQGEEGVWIEPAATQNATETICLAKDSRGEQVWCRLYQPPSQSLQASVLDCQDKKIEIESFDIPNVAFEDVLTGKKPVLQLFACLLLNRLTTADVPYLLSSANLQILLEQFESEDLQSPMIVSEDVVLSGINSGQN